MDIRPIKTEDDYEWALAEIEVYFDDEPAVGTADGNRFDVLATLIEAYERAHYSIDLPSPIEAIKERMEQKGLSRRDLEPMIGTRGRVSEVLEGKRGLSINMIRALSNGLDLSAEVLLQATGPARPKKVRRTVRTAAAVTNSKERRNKRAAARTARRRKVA
jgi:HTH-type transcriptional regulator/antitoxin HigA